MRKALVPALEVAWDYLGGIGFALAIIFVGIPACILMFAFILIYICLGVAIGALAGLGVQSLLNIAPLSWVVGGVIAIIYWYTIWFINEHTGFPFTMLDL